MKMNYEMRPYKEKAGDAQHNLQPVGHLEPERRQVNIRLAAVNQGWSQAGAEMVRRREMMAVQNLDCAQNEQSNKSELSPRVTSS